MQRLFLLCLTLCILGGCAMFAVSPNEPFDPAFAYVTGRTTFLGEKVEFRNLDDGDNIKLVIDRNKNYPLYKVSPGKYYATEVSHGNFMYKVKMSPFQAEAGKINYIGDLSITLHGRGIILINPQNELVSAKAAIEQKYPALAPSLDEIFVYSPLMRKIYTLD